MLKKLKKFLFGEQKKSALPPFLPSDDEEDEEPTMEDLLIEDYLMARDDDYDVADGMPMTCYKENCDDPFHYHPLEEDEEYDYHNNDDDYDCQDDDEDEDPYDDYYDDGDDGYC